MSNFDPISQRVPPDPKLKLTPRELLLVDLISSRVTHVARQVNDRLEQLNTNVGMGYPNDGTTGNPGRGNIAGRWASAILTNANQLGAGAGAPVVFSHFLNLPVHAVPGRAYNFPNVRWLPKFIYGDRTGVNGAPAAPANPAHNTLFFLLGDAVTANTIALRVHSNLAIAAATPLNIDVFFLPAVV